MAYKKSKETFDKIIKVATNLFITEGFNNTKIREICRQAEINHSLIYYYFPDGKYDILYLLIKEHEKKCARVIRAHVKTYSYLIYTLVWVRFISRELLQDENEMLCYIEAWKKSRPERNLFVENYTAAKELSLKVDAQLVKKATLMGDSVWSGLYQAKLNGLIELSHKEIRDATDITRWTFMGLSLEKINFAIQEAEEILENVPIQGIRLLELG